MNFDFYLSEMSVSDHHGGGLTLQRILGSDLQNISYFAHLNRMANDLPPNTSIIDRSLDLTPFWDSDSSRKIVGNTYARRISRQPFIIKMAAKKAAATLNSKFEKGKQLTALICPQGAAAIYTLEELKKHRPVKYITWVMDDHILKYQNGDFHYPAELEPLYAKHLQDAAHVFTISPSMQGFYQNRFGVNSTVLFGPADFAIRRGEPIAVTGAKLKIGYFGAVASWQLDALAGFSQFLKDVNATFHIYSGITQLPASLQLPNVYFEGKVNPDDVLATMRNYNAILLPMSFLETERHKSEFNIATKMSEYLASGVSILAVGPAYSAMIKYLKESNAAIIIDHFDDENVRKAFATLNDQQIIAGILKNAEKQVLTETGYTPMRKRWEDGVNKFLT